MDLDYTAEYQAFQEEVRGFLADNWPPKGADASLSREAQEREFRLQAIDRGYLYRGIPNRYGGSEQPADPMKARIITEEFIAARAPREYVGNGIGLVVPTLLAWGSDWQKEHFIPPAIHGEHIWCQGYSEPNAGSDLASLRTRAELVDDVWVINGQKVWTSQAHLSNYMFMLARTEPDAAKHDGISYLLVDMDQPGIEVRRLRQITGGASFNEVFFTDARTPADWIVGERGRGWEVSRTTLKHERSQLGGPEQGRQLFRKTVNLAKRTSRNGVQAIKDPEIRQWLVALEGFVLSSYWSGQYQFTMDAKGDSAGALQYMNKFVTLHIIELEIARIVHELIGDDSMLLAQSVSRGGEVTGTSAGHGAVGNERWVNQVLGSLAATMGGGTSNINRNIIAERGLGLPRDV
jgi:alkylation response protein AidB-like acyl-CoA dehydrogenase